VFTQDYWTRPENQNLGDADNNNIYHAVGYALTCWEIAEEALAELYLVLTHTEKSSISPVRRAFGSIESNSGRRKAIEAAAEAHFERRWEENDIRKAFLLVIDAVARASRRRDDLAHGIALGQQFDERSFGAFLFPPDYNTPRTHMYADTGDGDPLFFTMTKYRFTSQQIMEFANRFNQLKEAIWEHTGLCRDVELFVRSVRGFDILGGKLPGR
jgi:hypothetical protein